jgi:hypothetical protein
VPTARGGSTWTAAGVKRVLELIGQGGAWAPKITICPWGVLRRPVGAKRPVMAEGERKMISARTKAALAAARARGTR